MKFVLFVLLVLLVLYSRFLNLNWDSGWGFHPDENNLWGASRNVKLFSKLDPKFYAYGGFPIYLYSLFETKVEARAVSAILQTLIVILLFFTGKKLAGKITGFLTAVMAVFSAGLIQASHFLTVESLVGFLSLVIIYCLAKFLELPKITRCRNCWLLAAGIALGLGVGTKISFIVFTIPFFLILLRSDLWSPKVRPLGILKSVLILILCLLIALLIFVITNPYILSRWQEVKGTLIYESNVATGKLPVFYTKQFMGTIPGWFQVIRVFPFITGWLFMPLFLVGVIRGIREIRGIGDRKNKRAFMMVLLAVISALLSFLPFWAKWTRYVVQVLPILILVAGIGAGWIWEKGKLGKAIVILIIFSFLPQFSSMLNVYANEDTRITAANWARLASQSGQARFASQSGQAGENIPITAKIFTEGMDLGIIPFNPVHGENITLFNFYELDEDKTGQRQKTLDSLIKESDYFISVSQRVYGNSLAHPDRFPRSAGFYKSLFDGSLGYIKIYESSQVVIPGSNQESIYIDSGSTAGMTVGFSPEETFSVFDHPRLLIFKRIK